MLYFNFALSLLEILTKDGTSEMYKWADELETKSERY